MGIEKIYYVESSSFDPYYNLAIEELLLNRCKENELYLYLWQNDNTIVIGKNQSAYKECNMDSIKEDGVKISRRISGGGAVYHDLGNLNFTFVMHRDNYNLNRQLQVIKNALNKNGALAYFSGRNDLLIADKKVSGNAFYMSKTSCYHHGTVLVSSDLNKVQKYLKPSKSKLESKGVDSVRSRVENVSRFVKGITIDKVKEDIKEAVEEVYWLPLDTISVKNPNREKYAATDWIFRKEVESNYSLKNRFSWGELYIKFNVENNIIKDVQVFSDSMDIDLASELENALINSEFGINMINSLNNIRDPFKEDIINYLKEEFQ